MDPVTDKRELQNTFPSASLCSGSQLIHLTWNRVFCRGKRNRASITPCRKRVLYSPHWKVEEMANEIPVYLFSHAKGCWLPESRHLSTRSVSRSLISNGLGSQPGDLSLLRKGGWFSTALKQCSAENHPYFLCGRTSISEGQATWESRGNYTSIIKKEKLTDCT